MVGLAVDRQTKHWGIDIRKFSETSSWLPCFQYNDESANLPYYNINPIILLSSVLHFSVCHIESCAMDSYASFAASCNKMIRNFYHLEIVTTSLVIHCVLCGVLLE